MVYKEQTKNDSVEWQGANRFQMRDLREKRMERLDLQIIFTLGSAQEFHNPVYTS